MAVTITVVAWVLLCVPYALIWLLGGQEPLLLTYSLIVQIVTAMVAAATCYLAAATFPQQESMRKVWAWLGTGVLFWGIGAILYAVYPLTHQGHETPYPWFSDIGYALYPPSLVIAFIVFKGGLKMETPLWGRLGGFVLFLAALALYIHFNISRLEASDSMAAYAITILYTLENPLLLGGLVMTASLVAGGTIGRPLWLMLFGLACYCLSDLVYMYLNINQEYRTGHIIDLGWMVGFGCIAVAAMMTRQVFQGLAALSHDEAA